MDDSFLLEMGKRIHEKRKSLRLSQEELSKIKNLSDRQYQYLEEIISIFIKMCEDGTV